MIPKVKKLAVILIAFIALLAIGCTQQNPAPTATPTPSALATATPSAAPTATPTLVGGDRDEHGCIPSAGYSWCEAKQKCLRVWEENCTSAPTPSAAASASPSVAASVAPSAAASPSPSLSPSPSPSPVSGAPALAEVAATIEPVASSVLNVKVKIPFVSERMYAVEDFSKPLNYYIYVEYPIVNAFDAADELAVLTGPKTNESKTVAVLYGKIANAYFDYNVKQFCYGKRVLVTTKVREPLYPNVAQQDYGKKLAEQIIDVCPE